MANDGTMFIRSGHYIISDVLYQSAAINWPLKATTSLSFIGRTSTNLTIEIREQLTNQHVGSLEFQYVYVNRTNRKSQAFPDWFIQKYRPLTTLETRPDTMAPLSLPSKTFSYDVTVQYSDTDRNGHTNQSSYLKYGMDAATSASLGGEFHNFKQDMCMYHVQDFQALYTGESLVKDQLVIHTWEDGTRKDLLFFQIHKNNRAIFHCRLTLCNPASAKL
ncbi:unnamed protein product [Owenia fusiformis]|uniref:Uncharacterized protein n=1 Tax=Owenia fusiformis TaxID=6347 RepID=A0A8J1UAQ3_OWEFU|nr:unnamed protein product [Owenia fusiformis]